YCSFNSTSDGSSISFGLGDSSSACGGIFTNDSNASSSSKSDQDALNIMNESNPVIFNKYANYLAIYRDMDPFMDAKFSSCCEDDKRRCSLNYE
ncbi:MAG: hypothetical protein MHPSP_001933, partial [Paramarteilia canceri]